LILIITHPNDFHAFAVREALGRKGADFRFLYTTDFPTLQLGAIWTGSGGTQWQLRGLDLDFRGEPPATVWLRRAAPPVLPANLDPADRQFASRECVAFLNCLIDQAGSDAFWVNPIQAATRANLKTRQLRLAARSGLSIPETLCTNDPGAIRDFLRSHGGEALYKAFYPASWQTEDGVAVLFSSAVQEADLPEPALLQAVPGIFQAVVPKAYELRITIMGQRIFAVKLHSQETPGAGLDWRAASELVPLEEVELPEPVSRACLRIMEELGLTFGCFDMIVTPSQEYVFLEVNEMGAFLWIERQNPEIRLLDPFCEFLMQRSGSFRWDKGKENVRLGDLWDQAVQQMEDSASRHVRKESDTSADV
jgi:glutathione synthase/RimK-type ligase-like ATP-grasp enzyme